MGILCPVWQRLCIGGGCWQRNEFDARLGAAQQVGDSEEQRRALASKARIHKDPGGARCR
eukprot:10325842-Prorocentrum_lima.AAC.1